MGERIYTMDEIVADTYSLAQKIKESDFDPTFIVAIARGGLIIAGLLSYYLNMKKVGTVSLATYEGTEFKGKTTPILLPKRVDSNERILIVDDLQDTGSTMNWITTFYREKGYDNFMTSALYHKEKCTPPDFFVGIEEKDCWIILPWDIDPTK